MRQELKIPSGQQQEKCYATHAEQNALVQAARMGIAVEGATVYCTHQPCVICLKILINAGVARVVYKNEYPDEFSREIAAEAGFEMIQLP
jgi:dCMP deaminase